MVWGEQIKEESEVGLWALELPNEPLCLPQLAPQSSPKD